MVHLLYSVLYLIFSKYHMFHWLVSIYALIIYAYGDNLDNFSRPQPDVLSNSKFDKIANKMSLS
jgi:hypothetical protein